MVELYICRTQWHHLYASRQGFVPVCGGVHGAFLIFNLIMSRAWLNPDSSAQSSLAQRPQGSQAPHGSRWLKLPKAAWDVSEKKIGGGAVLALFFNLEFSLEDAGHAWVAPIPESLPSFSA